MANRSRAIPIVFFVLMSTGCARGGEPLFKWKSDAISGELSGQVLLPTDFDDSGSPRATVVYLTRLSIGRIGTEGDASIIRSFLDDGCIVATIDYANHPAAVSPRLNADILKLRRDIADTKARTLLTDYRVNPDRLFIICEGFKLKQNVEFARDGDRILAMDIIYPANPKQRVPVLMEITCDNVNRMGSFSLLYCHDTLLEGAPAAGFAAAMVDHPIRPPYKGIDDPMPESLERVKAAAAKLRAMSDELNLNGKVGAIGFSRGGPFAAMLACSRDVDAALIHGNRYDYLDLRGDDPMLPRFEKAWGLRASNREKWAIHGASYYLKDKAAPMFLNTSDAESAEYRDGLANFARKLKARGVEDVYVEDADGRGHRVTTDPKTLSSIYGFFARHLGN